MDKEPVCIEELVRRLREIPEDDFDLPHVDAVFSRVHLRCDSLGAYAHFKEGGYARNLVFKNELFEALLLCWDVGQQTPVHNHRGQLGWMLVCQGQLVVTNFKRVRCSGECYKEVRYSEMLADRTLTAGEGLLCHVQDGETVHQIRNDASFGQRAISLHVYSRPIASCVIYDVERRQCRDRILSNYSEYGQLRGH